MPVPETSRQYLPDLEARWKLSRRKILELARDGKLPLWIELWDVFLSYMAKDGSEKEEWADCIELKFFLGSLRQLCANAEIGDTWQPCWHISHSKTIRGVINGILRDGRKVLVWRKAKPTDQRGILYPQRLLLVKYSEVFSDLDDVKRLDREFGSDGNERIPTAQEPPLPVTDHQEADAQPVLQRGDNVYRGQREITNAYNRLAKTKIGWRAIRIKKDDGLAIAYQQRGKKEIPTLDYIDLLDYLDRLPT